MKRKLLGGLLLMCGSAWASVPPNTGQGGSGLDGNYRAVVGNSTSPAVILSPQPSGTNGSALWIGPPAGASTVNDGPDYILKFTVVDITKAKLTMSVLADPDVDIFLNGTFLPNIRGTTTPTVLTLTSQPCPGGNGENGQPSTTPCLIAGENTISFGVSAGHGYLSVLWGGTLGDGTSPPPPPAPKNTGSGSYHTLAFEEPVDSASGQYYDTFDDFALGGPLKLGFSRYYSSALSPTGAASALGTNWMSNFDTSITVSGTTAYVLLFEGKLLTFTNVANVWTLQSPLDTVYQLASAGTGYQLLDPSTRWIYTYASTGALTSIKDRNGNTITVTQGANGPTSATDGLGRTLTFTYTGAQLTKVADQSGRTFTFTYNGGTLQSATDDATHVTTYAYASSGALMTSRQFPLGNKPATEAYDSSGRVISQTDGRGNITKASYDGNGTTTITDPSGNVFRQTSDSNGNIIKVVDPNGAAADATNDVSQRRISGGDAAGNHASIVYHNPTGYIASLTDKAGNTTSYSYTSQTVAPFTFYNLSGIAYPDGTSEALAYDANGNRVSAIARDGSVTKWTYDTNGRMTSMTTADGAATTYTWNSDGTIASQTDAAGNVSTFGYDSTKRLNKFTDANGGVSTFTYGAAADTSRTYTTKLPASGPTTGTNDFNDFPQTSVDGTGASIRTTYTANNKVATITDATGNKTTYAYDANDRVASITDGSGVAVNYSFDANSRVKTITKGALLLATYSRDSDGRPTSLADGLGNKLSYSYDADGRLLSRTTTLGNKESWTYDKLGRITSQTDALGASDTYTLDKLGNATQIAKPGGLNTSISRNFQGQPVSYTTPNGNTWNVAYDALGRKSKLTDPLGNASTFAYTGSLLSKITLPLGTVAVTQDGDGRTTKLQYSDGTVINRGYDANGRLTTADNVALKRDAAGRITNSNGLIMTLDGAGRVVTITYASGKVITYAYDSSGRVSTITDWVGGKTTVTYDAVNHVASITYPSAVSNTYTYDADGRVTKIVYGILGSISLTRDAVGKITAADRQLPQTPDLHHVATQQLGYDAAGQLTTGGPDKMGRVTAQNGRTYKWDLASRMTSFQDGANSESFTYDGLGALNTMTTGSVTRSFVYNYRPKLPALSIVRQGASDVRYYVYLPDGELLYSVEADNTRRYYHFDEMGNTMMLSNDAGTATDSYAVTPYGDIADHFGTADNPFTWQGQFGVFQEGTGLFNARYRHYDASAARFISRDPVVQFDPRAVEPYAYAKGNPLRYVDPLGTEGNALLYAIYSAQAQAAEDASQQYAQAAQDDFANGDLEKWITDESQMLFFEGQVTPLEALASQNKPQPAPDLSDLTRIATLANLGSFDSGNVKFKSNACPIPDAGSALSLGLTLHLNAMNQLIDGQGYLIGHDGASLIGHDGASFAKAGDTIKIDGQYYLIGHDGASLINQDGAGITTIPASLIHQDGAGLIHQDGAGIVAAGAGNLVSAHGGKIISDNSEGIKPQLP